MPSLPRLITVDPQSTVAEQVRGALLLLDRLAIQVDVPSANDALEELKFGKFNAILAAWEPGDGMKGWELAARIRKMNVEAPILIIADYEDSEPDQETLAQSPFSYLKRPFDVPQFLRVISAILDSKSIDEAMLTPKGEQMGGILPEFGGVPLMDADKAKPILYRLATDSGAMGALLIARDGTVLCEHGSLGYLKRDELARAIVPATHSHLNLREYVTGNATHFQLFDGETYDLYALSVGFHHVVVLIFDGQAGAKAIGAVRSSGRRATEDLVGVLGANAWLMHAPVMVVREVEEEVEVRHRRTRLATPTEEKPVELAKATLMVEETTKDATQEANIIQMEPIKDLDFDTLFGGSDLSDADSLFSLDALEQELAKIEDRSSGGKLDWDKAKELGLLGGEQ
jgi:CheY-like chemotaxis protein